MQGNIRSFGNNNRLAEIVGAKKASMQKPPVMLGSQRPSRVVVRQKNQRPQRVHIGQVRPPESRLHTVKGQFHRIDLPEVGSFNGAILDMLDGRTLLVYRPNEMELVGCFLDEGYRPIKGSYYKFPLSKVADPRLVVTGGQTVLLSYSKYHSCVSSEHIAGNIIMDLRDPQRKIFCGDPIRISPRNLNSRQKNWMPFSWNDKVLFVANVSPHDVYECRTDLPEYSIRKYLTKWDSENWPWNQKSWFYPGGFRGNTNAVRMDDGNYLGTFHTSTQIGRTVHYDNGFYIFEGNPPFRPIRMSTKTYLPAESAVEPHFRKAGIILCTFPCGLMIRGDKVVISYGDNDSSVKIVETTMEEVMKTFEE